MEKRYNNYDGKLEKEINAKQVTTTSKTLSKAWNNLPAVFVGDYAETLSVYTDKNGNQALVPPGWMVSGAPNENIICGDDVGLIIYNIPKSELPKVDWANTEFIEKAKEIYHQNIWLTAEILSCSDELFETNFLKKYGKRRGIYDKFQLLVKARKKLRKHKNVKKYNGVYI